MLIRANMTFSTHNRSKGVSTVALASRLLKTCLEDTRTGVVHDHRSRARHEEIVSVATIRPEQTPEWGIDPNEIWNRVERIEKRKDAHLANEYTIHIPHGLDHDCPEEMATFRAIELAEMISNWHQTPVTAAVHRDADRDVFGEVKPLHQQGFRAHLLFPARSLLKTGEQGRPELEGFGPRLPLLSSRQLGMKLGEKLFSFDASSVPGPSIKLGRKPAMTARKDPLSLWSGWIDPGKNGTDHIRHSLRKGVQDIIRKGQAQVLISGHLAQSAS